MAERSPQRAARPGGNAHGLVRAGQVAQNRGGAAINQNRARVTAENRTKVNVRSGRAGASARPSVAFGGRTVNNVNVRNAQNFAVTRPVPSTVSRDWDHHRHHSWDHHQWGWRGDRGGWVAIDPGYPNYGYGFGAPYSGYGYGVDGGVYGSGYAPVGSVLVSEVQTALDNRGYDAGAVDGIFGDRTRTALASFQQDSGLNPSGYINSQTTAALGL